MLYRIAVLLSLVLSVAAQSQTDLDYQAGTAAWQKFKASQTRACDPKLDSYEVLTGQKTEYVAIVLHGFTLYPRTMNHFVEEFSGLGMNVIAPRLARHFTKNGLQDLDNVSYQEWINQTEAAYQVARHLGRKVIVVGFSLGGLLGTRLALQHPNDIKAMFLFSPALRMNPQASLAAQVGALIGTSLNQIQNLPVTCGSPYFSAHAGAQIEYLMIDNEHSFDGTFPGITPTSFWRLNMPIFMGVVGNDDAVDTDTLIDILKESGARRRGFVEFETGEHGMWTDASIMSKVPKWGYVPHQPISMQITKFWADIQGLIR